MADPLPFTDQADRLKIRAGPRPVTRINRRVLVALAVVLTFALFAGLSVALSPPQALSRDQTTELYNTTNKRPPEGLSALPASYANLTQSQPVPQLGPPLTGDLGATILEKERAFGIKPTPARDFRPNAEDEAARARRLAEAKLAEDAAKAPVFFQMSSKLGSAPMSGATPSSPSRTRSAFDAFAVGPQAAPRPAADVNLQSAKSAFASARSTGDIYNPSRLESPLSPYQVMAGTLIPASLVTGLNSDLPGRVIAQVTQPVYDTVAGDYLLIPQGTRLLGRYQAQISFGQDRALLVWERLIFPNGNSLTISEPGTDQAGYAGVADRVDHHWDRVFLAAGLATVLGVGAELGTDTESDIERAIRRGTTDTFNQAGQRVIDRSLGIQPTIRVRPGWPVRVLVTRDLVLEPYGEMK